MKAHPARRCAFVLLVLPPFAAAQIPSAEDVTGAACPSAKPRAEIAAPSVPTEKAYLALVETEQRKAARDMSPENMAALDRSLYADARAGAGADLGLLLLSINDVPAAVYATAISAKRDPRDAVTANNLGAALKVARAYGSAYTVLLYADSLQPASPVILVNLGNVAFVLGDGPAAGRYYQAALEAAPDHPPALTGLGSLALCAGDQAAAKTYFRKALTEMYLPGARAGLEASRDTGESDEGAGQPGGQASGARDADDAPIEHPTGKGGGEGLVLPDPPVTGSARATALGAERMAQLVEDAGNQMSDVSERLAALSQSMVAQAMAAAAGSAGGGGRFPNTFEKEQFVLDDLGRIFVDRMTRVLEHLPEAAEVVSQGEQKDAEIFEKGVQAEIACGDNDACVQAVKLKVCLERHANADQVHGRFLPIWQDLWRETHKNLSDYYAFSSPWLQDVRDENVSKMCNATRQAFILGHATALYSLAQGEAEAMGRFTEDDCTRLVPPKVAPDTRPLKVWPDDPTKCRSGSLEAVFVVASLEANCDGMKVTFTVGPFVSAHYKWGTASSNDQITLWGGLGTPEGIGPLKLKGKIGPYVTFDLGDSPKMVDYGLKDEASIGTTVGPVKLGASAEARFSAETGVTVDYHTSAKLSVKIPKDPTR